MIWFICTFLQLQSIMTAHNEWLSTTLSIPPFFIGLRVSFPLRDWLGSDLRIGQFFSFRYPQVNTPQLNTELLNYLLHSLTNESFEFTNELPFITPRKRNRNHHTEHFVFWSLVSVAAKTSDPLPSKGTSASVVIPYPWKRLLNLCWDENVLIEPSANNIFLCFYLFYLFYFIFSLFCFLVLYFIILSVFPSFVLFLYFLSLYLSLYHAFLMD
jgi:hypothetical protein